MGNTFALRMCCDMPTMPVAFRREWERMLALGLRLLEQGEVTLGGRAARGVGQVRLRDLEVYTLDTGDRAALLAALLADEVPARAGTRQPDQWPSRVLAEVV
jgi:CRISPR/Cas system CSM-associated protein Csm3 (group 7 of RAMP superfamily)